MGRVDGGMLSEVYSAGSVSGEYAGGLVGWNRGTITDAYSLTVVTGSIAGGLVGVNDVGGSIARAYSSGAVSGTGVAIAGLVGSHYSGASVEASFWDVNTSHSAGVGVQLGGTFNGSGKSTVELMQQATYEASGWDFGSVWYMIEGETRPFLRMEHDTVIRNAHQLQLMRMDLGADYVLANDIDLGNALAAIGGMWSSRGFVPVGNGATPFTGSLDGRGHVIDGLYIDRPGTDYVGLFGAVGPGGLVVNVGITGAEVAGRWRVGTLVGESEGEIRNTFSAGTVRGSDFVGGLTGSLVGGTLSRSYSRAQVTASGAGGAAGGLVGRLTSGSLWEVYSEGSVRSVAYSGGLVGLNDSGTITDAYGLAAVSGSRAGGLVGVNYGSVARAYSIGIVNGQSNAGALVGWNYTAFSSVADSFWDADTSLTGGVGVNDLNATFNASGASTAGLMSLATFTAAGWDFENTWGIVEGISYPYFRWRFPDGPVVVSGTVSGVSGGNDGLGVSVAADGAVAAVAHTGRNGIYYAALDPLDEGGALLSWLDGTRFGDTSVAERGNAASDLLDPLLNGHATGMDIVAGTLGVRTGQSSFGQTIEQVLERAMGSLTDADLHLYAVNTGGGGKELALDVGTSLSVTATGSSFTVDRVPALTGEGALRIVTTSGDLTVDQALSAETGVVTLISAGDVTLSAGASVTSGAASAAVVIAAANDFINHAGPGALSASAGRWLVYIDDLDGNEYGCLDSGNTALWNAWDGTAASVKPEDVAAGGNRYLFAYQPTLTFTSNDLTKTYGDDVTAALADPDPERYTVSGFMEGVAGAFLGDTEATAFSGKPVLTSAGAAANAPVKPGGYVVDIDVSGITSGYMIVVDAGNPGILTVEPKEVTITGLSVASKVYDGSEEATLETDAAVLQGVLFSDDVALDFTGAKAEFEDKRVDVNKAVTVSGIVLSGADAGNYTLKQPEGLTGTITPREVTVIGLRAVDRVYDGGIAVQLDIAGAGLDDAIAGDDVEPDFTAAAATVADPNAGTSKAVTVTGIVLSGIDAGNYTLKQPEGLTVTITLATLVVRPLPASRLTGEPNPEFLVEYSGFVAGEDASVLAGKAVFTTEATPSSPAGTYPVVVDLAATTLSAANYAFVYEPGVLTVTAPEIELPPPQPDCVAGATLIPGGSEMRWDASGVYCGARAADAPLFALESDLFAFQTDPSGLGEE